MGTAQHFKSVIGELLGERVDVRCDLVEFPHN
jgi:hypothetical protein